MLAKFKTTPFYSVRTPGGKINFDHNGEYQTENADEIALLKALSPRYLTVVEDAKKAEKPKEQAKATQTKAEDKPKTKPTAKK